MSAEDIRTQVTDEWLQELKKELQDKKMELEKKETKLQRLEVMKKTINTVSSCFSNEEGYQDKYLQFFNFDELLSEVETINEGRNDLETNDELYFLKTTIDELERK
ncbi:hypothetical protein J2Z83_000086 [Virgibacillus natechei]|uniref:DUF5082 domain-containing protein n=1 Tax=Virgibacillus natechei TaxID=1216297 RepID=A0ABS4IAN8_9BACI|nr:hypothetical protein [Virgibacillus natechei]MBP1967994.1 hypothetical protein [Virgibacillus natechei]UZD14722.1 hypothetical protein OLD84_09565 [Virgibacillus natechei]